MVGHFFFLQATPIIAGCTDLDFGVNKDLLFLHVLWAILERPIFASFCATEI